MAKPILEMLRDEVKAPTLLKHLVLDWIHENTWKLDHYSQADFKFLERLLVQGTTRDPEVFSPSGFTDCRRAQIITKTKALLKRRDITPQLAVIFNDGSWRHLRWQMVFWKMGIVKSAEEFTSRGKFDLGGSTDVVIEIVINAIPTRIIVDIKGANAAKWNAINRTGKPEFSHLVQIMSYLILNGLDIAILFYENKNTNEICEVVVRKDPVLMEKILRRVKYMQRYAEASVFPREECQFGDPKNRRFRGCLVKELCQRLPVYVIKDGHIHKTHDPRKRSKKYAQYNQSPLSTLPGSLGERALRLKRLPVRVS